MRDGGEEVEYESIGKVRVTGLTDKAAQVRVGGFSGHTVWIPRSVIDTDNSVELQLGESGEMFVAAWFAEQEGL